MGKLVSFWSPYVGHGKTTSSLCAIVGGFTMLYPELSLAVSHTQKDSVSLLKKLDAHACVWKDKGLLDGFGVDALKMYGRQNLISTDHIRRCGLPLSGKSLFFYPNYSKNGRNDDLTFQVLTKHLKKEFEIVFLDLKSGNKEEALPYMRESDYVVVVLPQEPLYIESFLLEKDVSGDNVDYGVVFGGCFSNSQYGCTYYKKKYGKRLNDIFLGEILLNADYYEAMSVGKTVDFFLRNNTPVKKEENYEFIVQVKKTTERIQKKLLCL